ncbi:MAG TPA: hypothetical protein VLA92_00910, partial [Candidatus Saccharimonadales bacterium]|nr:hypothetical protein [Candidatus Saccharimonadales bacterium]
IGITKRPIDYEIEALEQAANGVVLEKVKVEVQAPIVFLARLPVEEGASLNPDYELTAQKLDRLHVAAAALIRHIN